MALAEDSGVSATPPSLRERWQRFWAARTADPAFRRWAARTPLVRRIARRDGERLFDLMAGFTYSQIVMGLVELDIISPLSRKPRTLVQLAGHAGCPEDQLLRLLRGAEALGLLRRTKDGAFVLDRLGVALAHVPGLAEMVRHHSILYRDLADPAAFLRQQTSPELAAFWPYVFGAGAAEDPEAARRYSALMADTQTLVAEEVLSAVDFTGSRALLDIGGGTGTFLAAVLGRHAHLTGTLFDLPAVVSASDTLPVEDRLIRAPGDFRNDGLPAGADTITLVRVCYDHDDGTVAALLSKIHEALPPKGRLIIAEPMSSGEAPDRFADGYFAFYCMAMGTGCVRSTPQMQALCRDAGFDRVREVGVHRPFVTRVVEAIRD